VCVGSLEPVDVRAAAGHRWPVTRLRPTDARLADLVAASREVAATRARLGKLGRLAGYLGPLDADAAALAVSYLAGELPQGKIGVGWSMVAGVRDATGRASPAAPSLSLADVDGTFAAIAATAAGAGSNRSRKDHLGRLFARATADEAEFLAALAVGEVRQGALGALVGEALARAHEVPAAEVRRAVMVAGNLREVARALGAAGRAGLAGFTIAPFRPLLPMLAQTADGVGEALAQLGEAIFEHKLDGYRVQVHKDGERVAIYSRGGHDVTAAVPELVAMAAALPVRRAILDGEAIALRDSGRPHIFQTTMRRFGTGAAAAELLARLPLSPYLFDVLLLDDELVLDRPTTERLAALDELVPAACRVPRLITADAAAAQRFLDGALAAGHEGAIAKALDAGYDAGNRGASWLKLKKVHTLDLVILAAEWGSGRRRGWLSNLHLGARDPERGFAMLGKTFKGLTDEILTWQTAQLLARETARDGHIVHVRPELVAEIAFNDVMSSSQYPAGLSLRLARLIRYRPDRTAADADTIEAVRAIAIADGVLDPPG
jgi:DNA ligase-1